VPAACSPPPAFRLSAQLPHARRCEARMAWERRWTAWTWSVRRVSPSRRVLCAGGAQWAPGAVLRAACSAADSLCRAQPRSAPGATRTSTS
jgi:hypothetical protein